MTTMCEPLDDIEAHTIRVAAKLISSGDLLPAGDGDGIYKFAYRCAAHDWHALLPCPRCPVRAGSAPRQWRKVSGTARRQ